MRGLHCPGRRSLLDSSVGHTGSVVAVKRGERSGWTRSRRSDMRSDTQTVTIAADPLDVLDFVRQPENRPRWAIGFAKQVSHGENGWTVVTGQGPVGLAIEVDDVARTVDFCMQPAPSVEAKAFSRILSNGEEAE